MRHQNKETEMVYPLSISRMGAALAWFVVVLLGLTPALAQTGEKFLGNIYTGQPDTLFGRYWTQVTPENAGKWESVEYTRDKMLWSGLDQMMAAAKERGSSVKQHTFI